MIARLIIIGLLCNIAGTYQNKVVASYDQKTIDWLSFQKEKALFLAYSNEKDLSDKAILERIVLERAAVEMFKEHLQPLSWNYQTQCFYRTKHINYQDACRLKEKQQALSIIAAVLQAKNRQLINSEELFLASQCAIFRFIMPKSHPTPSSEEKLFALSKTGRIQLKKWQGDVSALPLEMAKAIRHLPLLGYSKPIIRNQNKEIICLREAGIPLLQEEMQLFTIRKLYKRLSIIVTEAEAISALKGCAQAWKKEGMSALQHYHIDHTAESYTSFKPQNQVEIQRKSDVMILAFVEKIQSMSHLGFQAVDYFPKFMFFPPKPIPIDMIYKEIKRLNVISIDL